MLKLLEVLGLGIRFPDFGDERSDPKDFSPVAQEVLLSKRELRYAFLLQFYSLCKTHQKSLRLRVGILCGAVLRGQSHGVI
jgi:hypothetical protein